MLKDILIVAPFVSLPGEYSFDRFLYLANMWSNEYNVTLVTSRFCHFNKCHRDRKSDFYRDLPFDLVLLDEPGYRNNVSFARIASHLRFATALREWLAKQAGKRHIDVAYSAYPLFSTNLILANFKKRLGFKLIIDVIDVWPEAIASAFPILSRFDAILWPLTKLADRTYGRSDGLIAVSKTYLSRARKRCPEKPGMVAYLGADIGLVDSIPAASSQSSIFKMVYFGTISHSYDLATIVQGTNSLRQCYPDIELHIIGDGPHRQKIQALGGDGVFFHGYVAYNKMVEIAKSCDLAINPIVKTAAQSVTYKVSDYFALGLPILSSQRNLEVIELIRKAGGVHYEAGNVQSFCEAVRHFIAQSDRDEIRLRTKKIGVEMFDRSVTYPRITKFLQNIYSGIVASDERSVCND